MDAQQELRFEQHEPRTEDQVIQMNMEDDKNSKSHICVKNLDQNELQNLIKLIQKCIDVFVWNYEDTLGLDPKIAKHHLNIKRDAKPVETATSKV